MNGQSLDVAGTDRHDALGAPQGVRSPRCRLTEESEMEALRIHLRATQAAQRAFVRRARASGRHRLKRQESRMQKRAVVPESSRAAMQPVLSVQGRHSVGVLLASSRRHAVANSLTLTGIIAAVGGWFVGLTLFG